MRMRRFNVESVKTVAFGLVLWGASFVQAALGPATNEVPKLVFGAVSDTHIMMSASGRGPSRRLDGEGFEKALICFRAANVDAVVHCGDWAHRGHIREMELSRQVWDRVFPNDALPNGQKVAKLFVTGNHDYFDVNDKSLAVYKCSEMAKMQMLCRDMPRQWERIWGIPLTDKGFKHCCHYEVKGFHFLASHWSEKDYTELIPFSTQLKKSGVLTADEPLFVLTHSVLPARTRRHLSKNFSTGINLFGHWHTPHTNANFAVRSAKSRMKSVEIPCSRKDCPTRHGYIVKVYENRIVFECWDFDAKRKIRPDWVRPIAPPQKNSDAASGATVPPLARRHLVEECKKMKKTKEVWFEAKLGSKHSSQPSNPPTNPSATNSARKFMRMVS